MDGIIYTNKGGVKFPDETIQTTAATSHLPNPNSLMREGIVMEVKQQAQAGVPFPITGPYNSPRIGDVPQIRNALPLIEASIGTFYTPSQVGGSAAKRKDLSIRLASEENTPNFLGIITTVDVIERINLHWLTSDGNGGKVSHMLMEIQNATIIDQQIESNWVNGRFVHELNLTFTYERVRYITYLNGTEIQNVCRRYDDNTATCPDPF